MACGKPFGAWEGKAKQSRASKAGNGGRQEGSV